MSGKCASCGRSVQQGWEFCPGCGGELSPDLAVNPPGVRAWWMRRIRTQKSLMVLGVVAAVIIVSASAACQNDSNVVTSNPDSVANMVSGPTLPESETGVASPVDTTTTSTVSETTSTTIAPTTTLAPTTSTAPATTSSTVTVATAILPLVATNDGVIVHITETGKKYHRAGCGYLKESDIQVTLAEALARGLDPCSRCDPPM
jgi:cytoskeletal protein RodZ